MMLVRAVVPTMVIVAAATEECGSFSPEGCRASQQDGDDEALLSIRAVPMSKAVSQATYEPGVLDVPCPGSLTTYCGGNQCCGGPNPLANDLSFVCPTAEPGWNFCIGSPPTLSALCTENVDTNCTGSDQEMQTCRWSKKMDCCLAEACRDCSGGLDCATCYQNHQAECCKDHGIPETYHKCYAPRGLPRPPLQDPLPGALDVPCPGSLTVYCGGNQCCGGPNPLVNDLNFKCPSADPDWNFCLAAPPPLELLCTEDVDANCTGNETEREPCQWSKKMDCCLAEACRECTGGQDCASCYHKHQARCCEDHSIPRSYHKCGPLLDTESGLEGVLQKKAMAPLDANCPGSAHKCGGPQCCGGSSATNGRTFPCPSAPKNWNGCDTEPPSLEALCIENDLVAASCNTGSEQQRQECAWGKQVDCCLARACRDCPGGKDCASCHQEHQASCCAAHNVPAWYAKCSMISLMPMLPREVAPASVRHDVPCPGANTDIAVATSVAGAMSSRTTRISAAPPRTLTGISAMSPLHLFSFCAPMM